MARSGEILYSRRPNAPHPPASTVKLLTALIVWEATGLKGEVKVDVSDTRVEPSHVPLRAGETVPVRDLTTALLVGSANDTAMALGRHVAGSHEAFMRLMNQRARELGCRDSLFKNPNGLPAPGQVTTCRDMMVIFQHVPAVGELRRICALPACQKEQAPAPEETPAPAAGAPAAEAAPAATAPTPMPASELAPAPRPDARDHPGAGSGRG